MRWAGLSCLVVIGCSFHHGSVQRDAGSSDDATDARGMMCITYSSLFDTCMVGPSATTTALTLSGVNTYDTDTGTLTTPGGPLPVSHLPVTIGNQTVDVLFVSAFTLTAGASLRVVGDTQDRPFGIASPGAVEIHGVIDLSRNGAGARNDVNCGTAIGKPGTDRDFGAGGGGGAALRGAGGGGGKGNLDGMNSNGGAGGTALTMIPLGVLGGCDGGNGGDGNNTVGGLGGDGGGAIFIASATSIVVGSTGIIDVGGSGGAAGGNSNDGGGGGGSGGMIHLESGTVTIEGALVANGGGGGEGNLIGNPGQNALRTAERAQGGQDGDANGGDGEDGGAGVDLAGRTATDLRNGGGGGGGGGVGFIVIVCPAPTTSAGTISPSFQQ